MVKRLIQYEAQPSAAVADSLDQGDSLGSVEPPFL